MGSNNLPKIFVNDPAETPDAEKWNDNFNFLNKTQFNLARNGEFEGGFTAGVPNLWSLSGAGASAAADADSKESTNAVLLTFGSAAASLKQSSQEFKFYQGRTAKAWVFVKTSSPDIARIRIDDGVGSTDSDFHNGDGTYQLLTVVHAISAVATELSVELRIEGTGSAKFDVIVLVDFHDCLGRLPNPEDLAAATKEFFVPAPNPGSTVGAYAVESIASAGDIHHAFRIPHDFNLLVSAVIVIIPADTAGPQTVNIESNFAADGEDATTDGEGPTAITPSYVANQMSEFDVSSVFTGIAAGDFVGFHWDRVGNGFGNHLVLGVRFRYT